MSKPFSAGVAVPSAATVELFTTGLFDWNCLPPEIQTFCVLAAQHATCSPMRVLAIMLPLFQSLLGPSVVNSTTYEQMVSFACMP